MSKQRTSRFLSFFRIKKLDYLILRSFMGPFFITFFVVLFVFTLQFYWVYMDELIGKGFSMMLMAKLLGLMSATLFPLALPLGILLAAIMTFGNLGERFELVAIKSSGISLFRFMRPLIIFIGFVSLFAFFFSNYVIPVANLKSYSLLYDMRKQKPSVNMRAGVFNTEFDNYVIRVGRKGEDGESIYNVIIYNESDEGNNNDIIIAKSGKMYATADQRYLVFELHDGWRYEEGGEDNEGEQTRMHFGTWYKMFDLSGFAFQRTKEELFKSNEKMMNVGQLQQQIDSMNNAYKATLAEVRGYFNPYFSIYEKKKKGDSLLFKDLQQNKAFKRLSYNDGFLTVLPSKERKRVVKKAENNLRNMRRLINISGNEGRLTEKKNDDFKIEWHKKFTLAFACMLLFLIGAPLGAIIRKGGIGMPIVIAVGFFIIYFIISSTGEKLAKQGAVPPWYGIWLATGILLPIAFIIMTSARNDSAIFKVEWYLRGWRKIKRLFVKMKS